MKSSLSRKNIIEYFDKFDGKFTIISFNSDTESRIFTHAGLNLFDALKILVIQNNLNRLTRVYLNLPSKYSIAKSLSLIPESYIWNPDPYREFKRNS